MKSYLKTRIKMKSYLEIRREEKEQEKNKPPAKFFAYIKEPTPTAKFFAYIKEPTPKENQKDSSYLYFKLTSDPEVLLRTPLSDTIFVDTPGEEGAVQLEAELERRYPVANPMAQKYPAFFKTRFNWSWQKDYVTFSLEPKLKISMWNEKTFATIVEIVKEKGSFEITQYFSQLHDKEIKSRFNRFGIVVRPYKEILEYNPKAAKKQLEGIKKAVKKALNHKQILPYRMLQNFLRDLNSIIRMEKNLEIKYFGYTDRKKDTMCRSVLFYVDLYNLFFKDQSYRNLDSYCTMIKTWKEMKKSDRMKFIKEFRSFMFQESKHPLKPKKYEVNPYQNNVKSIKPKHNIQNFKHSKCRKKPPYY